MLDRLPGQPYEEQFAVALDGAIAGLQAQVERRRPDDYSQHQN
jgi:hypothetical protein